MKKHAYFRIAIAAILFTATIESAFAACPTHTGGPQPESTDQNSPRFDWEHYATGDWFGLRNTLYDYGIEITGAYTSEPAGNPVGGLKQGETYLDNFGFGFLFNLDKLAGISDTTFLVTVSQRTGRSLSADFIGNAISVQQIFGGGETFRLVQMRVDQKFFDERLELIYGRVTTTADPAHAAPLFSVRSSRARA